MRRLLALVLVLVAASIAVWVSLRPRPVAAPTVGAEPTATQEVARPPTEPAPPATVEPTARVEAAEAAAPVELAPAAQTAPTDDLAELRGRFVLPNGAPAVGVALTMHGWEANEERVQKYGLPKDWPEEFEATSDADGRFSLRFDPPRAFQFVLDAQVRGYSKVSWRWDELPPRQVTDVGEIALAVAGSIHGRVVDKSGRPVAGQWQVYGESTSRPLGHGGDETRVNAAADPVTGEFRLESLPPGSVGLKAYSRIANWIDGPRVDVRAGEESAADIVYAGPDNSRRIAVIPFSMPFFIFSHDVAGITLTNGSGTRREAAKIANSSQSWSFEDLEPGSYTVSIDDPRFESWSKSGVSPGQSVDAHLTGSAAVQLAVTGPDGAEIDAYRLRVRFRFGHGRSVSPDTFDVRGADEALPPGGVFRGLIPMNCALIVEAPGFAASEVAVDGLAPHETRAVSVALAPASLVRGRVVGAPATSIKSAKVALASVSLGAETALDFLRGQVSFDDPPKILTTELDAQGAFEFNSVEAGQYVLVADANAYLSASSASLDITRGGTTNVDLILPANAFVAGRVLLPEGVDTSRMLIDVKSGQEAADTWDEGWWIFDGAPPPRARIAADGTFRLGPLPRDAFELSLAIVEGALPADVDRWEGGASASYKLGQIAIEPPRDTQVEYDARPFFPGSAVLVATVDGAPAVGYTANAKQIRAEANAAGAFVRAPVDANGTAHFGVLAPGDWQFGIGPTGSAQWIEWADAKINVQSQRESQARIDVVLYSGALRVLDATTGAPLANRAIRLGQPSSGSSTEHTDAQGLLSARLPSGTYVVADQGDGRAPVRPAPAIEIQWTSSGPVPAEVRVELAKPLDIKLPGNR